MLLLFRCKLLIVECRFLLLESGVIMKEFNYLSDSLLKFQKYFDCSAALVTLIWC